MSRRLLRKGKKYGGQTDVNLGSDGVFRRKFYDECMIRYGYLILYLYPPTNDRRTISYGHTISTKKGNTSLIPPIRSMHHLSLSPTLLALALPLLSQYALPTLANTEIINFEAGKPILVAPLSKNW